MSERRTAVRMLQAQCLEDYPSGGEPGPRICAALSSQPPTLSARASRRRSACFLLPPTEIIESYRADVSLSCSGSVYGSTGSASPVLQPRRAQVPPDNAGIGLDAALPSSPPGSGSTVGASDPDMAPFHLSVPLTLLSLHNGGMRHSPRASRDASPVSCFLISREGSIICRSGDIDGIDEVSGNDTPDGAGACLSSGCKRPSERSSVCDAPPPLRTSSLVLRSAPFPTATSPAAAGLSPPIPSRVSATGVMTATARVSTGIELADLPSPSGVLSPTASAGGKSPPLPEVAGAGAGAGGAACSGNIALPGHLCSHRPPTPVCKEDDLLASMRHMSSPTRRRSRFASTTDSPLFAAAAAAIASEEADLLDSPRGGGGGSGAVNGGSGNWSCSAMASEPRCGTRRGTLGVIADSSGNGSGGVGVAGAEAAVGPVAAGGLTPRAALPAAAAAGLGQSVEHSLRSPSSLSMTWRASSQLVPVIEEALRPLSRADGPTVQRDAATTSAGLRPQSGCGSGGGGSGSQSLVTAGSFPRAATPGPGAVALGAGVAGVGRRLRNNSSSCMLDSPAEISCAGLTHSQSFRLGGAGAGGSGGGGSPSTGGGDPGSGAGAEFADDSLSSFMHSFGPGTPSTGRRCPVATPPLENGTSSGLGLGAGHVGLGVAGGGKITAR